ncbi:unnamed protein product, partial [Staurois parvus]
MYSLPGLSHPLTIVTPSSLADLIAGYPPPSSVYPTLLNRSISATPLCQSLHWPPLSVLHPSLPIPPLASTQCPPPLSANPSTGLHSPVLHPSLPIPRLASSQCSSTLSANPSTGLHS